MSHKFFSLADLAEQAPHCRPPQTKRCPFCLELIDLECVLYGTLEDQVPTFRVMCGRCGAAGTIGHTPQLAWKLWNKRELASQEVVFAAPEVHG